MTDPDTSLPARYDASNVTRRAARNDARRQALASGAGTRDPAGRLDVAPSVAALVAPFLAAALRAVAADKTPPEALDPGGPRGCGRVEVEGVPLWWEIHPDGPAARAGRDLLVLRVQHDVPLRGRPRSRSPGGAAPSAARPSHAESRSPDNGLSPPGGAISLGARVPPW